MKSCLTENVFSLMVDSVVNHDDNREGRLVTITRELSCELGEL